MTQITWHTKTKEPAEVPLQTLTSELRVIFELAQRPDFKIVKHPLNKEPILLHRDDFDLTVTADSNGSVILKRPPGRGTPSNGSLGMREELDIFEYAYLGKLDRAISIPDFSRTMFEFRERRARASCEHRTDAVERMVRFTDNISTKHLYCNGISLEFIRDAVYVKEELERRGYDLTRIGARSFKFAKPILVGMIITRENSPLLVNIHGASTVGSEKWDSGVIPLKQNELDTLASFKITTIPEGIEPA